MESPEATGEPPAAEIPTPVRRPDAAPEEARRRKPSRALVETEGDEDAEADQAAEVRHARDTLGGHVVVGLNGGLFAPVGSFDQTTDQSDRLGLGWSAGGDLGYGVSHTVVIGAFGELGMPKGESCSTCKGSSLSVGPFVRYHLVQGVRFDPWLSYGVGFRKTTLESANWTGIDVARIGLGGDFYAWPSLGIGPFAELAVGTFFDATPKLASHSVNAHFTLGLRVVFDTPGK